LLSFVEAVDLVDEKDGALAGLCRAQAGFLDVAPQVGHPGTDRAERDEVRRGHPGDQPRQRRLAATPWSPEDHRANPILLDGAAQLVLRTDQVLLPHKLLERARPHSGGERLIFLRGLGGYRKEGLLRHPLTIEAALTRRGTLRGQADPPKQDEKRQPGEQVEQATHRERQLVAALHLQKAADERSNATDADAADDDLGGCEPGALARVDV